MATTPPNSSTSTIEDEQINYYANLLEQQYPGNLSGENYSLAQAYTQYMFTHPGADPGITYQTVIARLGAFATLPKNIASDIGAGLQKTGQVSQSIGPAAGAAAQQINNDVPGLSGINAIGDFFSRLSEKNTWIRIGEGVVAIILLDVGLKALTGKSVIETTGKKISGGSKAAARTAMFA